MSTFIEENPNRVIPNTVGGAGGKTWAATELVAQVPFTPTPTNTATPTPTATGNAYGDAHDNRNAHRNSDTHSRPRVTTSTTRVCGD